MIKFKKGFSLLVAIFVIVLLSVVSAYIFYASSSIVKEGQIQYQDEQARLLARSYTEYAVLAISANDRSINCIDKIKADIGNPDIGKGYKIEVDITYIGNVGYNIGSCSHKAAILSNSDEDTLSVILDVYVKYKDPIHPNVNSEPWIVYHRRSIQKIWKKEHLV